MIKAGRPDKGAAFLVFPTSLHRRLNSRNPFNAHRKIDERLHVLKRV